MSGWILPPALDDAAYATLRVETVQRAMELTVEMLGRGRFKVSGGYEPHYLDLYDPEHNRCDCHDHNWRNRMCKHLAAVLIRLGDYRMWCRLQELLEEILEPQPPT